MVRLKEYLNHKTIAALTSFNSTMVRLKGNRNGHTSQLNFICFNSTMVRLKVEKIYEIAVTHTSFNSTMVRLKGIKEAPNLQLIRSFNSTMVRLKDR